MKELTTSLLLQSKLKYAVADDLPTTSTLERLSDISNDNSANNPKSKRGVFYTNEMRQSPD